MTLPIVLVGGLLILVLIVLAYRLLNRDPNVTSSRWGVFVERERYDDEPPEVETQAWPDREEKM